MNVANQTKGFKKNKNVLKKDTQHFKRQSWWDILYQLKKIPLNTSCENCLL